MNQQDLKQMIDFQKHPIFGNSVIGSIFFDNGYGLSIIIDVSLNNLQSTDFSRNKFNVTVLKGKKTNNQIVFDNEIKNKLKNIDSDYDLYCKENGIWSSINQNKVFEKIQMISNLEK